jgi:hypothetical protein
VQYIVNAVTGVKNDEFSVAQDVNRWIVVIVWLESAQQKRLERFGVVIVLTYGYGACVGDVAEIRPIVHPFKMDRLWLREPAPIGIIYELFIVAAAGSSRNSTDHRQHHKRY